MKKKVETIEKDHIVMLLEELRAEFKVFMEDLAHIKKTSEAISEMICALRKNIKAITERDIKSSA